MARMDHGWITARRSRGIRQKELVIATQNQLLTRLGSRASNHGVEPPLLEPCTLRYRRNRADHAPATIHICIGVDVLGFIAAVPSDYQSARGG